MLISESYRRLQFEHHQNNLDWGQNGHEHVRFLLDLVNKHNTNDILDYGCGKGSLAAHMPFPIKEYDPAFPEKCAMPAPADIVHCNQIIQHVEPECLDAVLAHLSSLTKIVCCIWAKVSESQTVWPDGRNATMQLQTPEWWFAKIAKQFPDEGKIIPEYEDDTLVKRIFVMVTLPYEGVVISA